MFATHRHFMFFERLLSKCDFTSDLLCISIYCVSLLNCFRATVSVVRPGGPSVGLPTYVVNCLYAGLLMNVAIINK